MDLTKLWSDVVHTVASGAQLTRDRSIILMFESQVSINVTDNDLFFICTSDYIEKLLPEYTILLYNEILRLLNKSQLNIHIVTSSKSNIAVEENAQPITSPVTASFTVPSSNRPNAPEVDVRKMPDFMRRDYINPTKTFENYVVDPENELIVTIAKKIAAEPGSANTNPFYIYGESGLGKTHLLFAIANRIQQTKPDVQLIYTRAEDFIHNYVEAVSRQNSFDYKQVYFQDFYANAKVFIVDDIQNFVRAMKSRDTFFDIVADFLERSDKQLILASDQPPGNLQGFSTRLKSRFGSGVCREIYPPTSETRAAITLRKCREFQIALPDAIVQYIATHIRSNVREIEGALKTLNSHIVQYGSISYDEAVKMLSSRVNVAARSTSLEAIKERVAKEFEVTVESLNSAERKKSISTARSVAMSLARKLIPSLSLNDIGRSFNKDHSSVHEALKRTEQRLEEDPEFAAVFQNLTLSLKKE